MSAGLSPWSRRPRSTVRVRMALSYWGLFVISGAVLLAVTVALWQGATTISTVRPAGPAQPGGVTTVRGSDLAQLLVVSGIALAIMAVVSVAFGWLVAGRFLGPVRAITATARRISATSLHERINLEGPDDDLKELADTFDNLLGRLERSFQFERSFAANASHELRTPLTTMRVWLDVAMAKPGPLPQGTVVLADRIRNGLDHVDSLLESFLTLARAQQGPAEDQAILALGGIVAAAVDARAGAISVLGLTVRREESGEVRVRGSRTLLTRMIDNVIDNAIKHNQRGGWVGVSTGVSTGAGPAHARIVVENGGAVLTGDDVGELARPFRRSGAERTGSDHGSGLGLSIVKAIAEVHDGGLDLQARPGGGLRVVITLPLAAAGTAVAPGDPG